MNTLNRWSVLNFNSGLQSKNRVVVPPMASSTATVEGFVTDATLSHYRRLALSGAGIVFVEYTYVHPTGRGEEQQLGIYHDGQIVGLTALAMALKKSGALAGIQLVHNGAKAETALTGQTLLGASAVAVPVKDRSMETPREISALEIPSYQQWHVDAVRRAAQAGFQLVEFHAAHGYGLNQWLSSITNRRSDQYGGAIENRARMLLEIFARVRTEFPNMLFGFRLPGEDNYPGGLSSDEMIWVARQLQDAGIDFLDVSSGIGGWRRPAHREGEGYLVPEATRIQAAVRVPVIGVGGIKTGQYIDGALGEGLFSLAAVGRGILENPQSFYQEVLKQNLL